MRLPRLRLALALLVLAAGARAHTLRVISTYPGVEPGGKSTVYLSWGHLLPVDELIRGEDVERFEVRSPSGSVTPLKVEELSLQAHALTFPDAGVHQVAALRKPSVFTRYTDASGKTVFSRQAKDELKLPAGGKLIAAARSIQSAKTLVVVGEGVAGRPVEPLGHALEIVPDAAPAADGYPIDKPASFRVLFQGKPLAGTTIVAVSAVRNPDGVGEVSVETDSEGRAILELDETGTWILEAHHLTDPPADQKHRFDSESYTATLAIGVFEEL